MSGMFLVWSNEHGAWWAPNHAGYTRVLEAAGRYDQAEAERICQQAANGGPVPRETSVGEFVRVAPEVMVPAPDQPEAAPARRFAYGWD